MTQQWCDIGHSAERACNMHLDRSVTQEKKAQKSKKQDLHIYSVAFCDMSSIFTHTYIIINRHHCDITCWFWSRNVGAERLYIWMRRSANQLMLAGVVSKLRGWKAQTQIPAKQTNKVLSFHSVLDGLYHTAIYHFRHQYKCSKRQQQDPHRGGPV